MRCPACTYHGSKVLDSRPIDDNRCIRRRRECEKCGTRFTTFEKIEEIPLIVVKKEGIREEFNKDKIQIEEAVIEKKVEPFMNVPDGEEEVKYFVVHVDRVLNPVFVDY